MIWKIGNKGDAAKNKAREVSRIEDMSEISRPPKLWSEAPFLVTEQKEAPAVGHMKPPKRLSLSDLVPSPRVFILLHQSLLRLK